MKTGKTRTRRTEPHLDKDCWIQVYPDGRIPGDLAFVGKIPLEHKTYSVNCPPEGHQSPILVRKSYWEAIWNAAKTQQ